MLSHALSNVRLATEANDSNSGGASCGTVNDEASTKVARTSVVEGTVQLNRPLVTREQVNVPVVVHVDDSAGSRGDADGDGIHELDTSVGDVKIPNLSREGILSEIAIHALGQRQGNAARRSTGRCTGGGAGGGASRGAGGGAGSLAIRADKVRGGDGGSDQTCRQSGNEAPRAIETTDTGGGSERRVERHGVCAVALSSQAPSACNRSATREVEGDVDRIEQT